MSKIRMTALLLAVLTLTSVFAACRDDGVQGNAGDVDTKGENPVEATTAAEDETEILYEAKIPDGVDYTGRDFTIMVYNEDNATWYDVDFNATEENGEPINDAVYRRTAKVEAKLGINIERAPVANYGMSPLKKSVQTGDHAYDAGFVNTRGAVSLAEDKYLYDLNSITDLQLDAAWWDQNAVKDLSIGNRLFMVTGDISIMYKKSLRVVYYNKAMAADFTLDNPYRLMEEHKWTFDAMADMAKEVAEDTNGDGVHDENDRYGFVYSVDSIALGLIASGVEFASKDADDMPYIDFYNERTQQVWEKYISLFYDKVVADNCIATGHDGAKMFINDQALFCCIELHNIERLRDMATDFGILPMPLYEESQEEYHCTINPHVAAMLVIPADSEDVTFTSHVLDSLGAESKNLLTPAYYEKYLKGKSARDDESEVSLDIIFSSVRYDLGYAYDWGTLGDIPLNLVKSYKEDFASQYNKLISKAQKALDRTLQNYEKME